MNYLNWASSGLHIRSQRQNQKIPPMWETVFLRGGLASCLVLPLVFKEAKTSQTLVALWIFIEILRP